MPFMPARAIPACLRVCRSPAARFAFGSALASKVDEGFTRSSCFPNFSTGARKKSSSFGGSSREVLLRKLGAALDDRQTEVAWNTFCSFRKLYGFPDISITSRLLTNLTYSSEPDYLQDACEMVFLCLRKKSDFFRFDVLVKLALAMARAQLAIPTSKILQLLLDRNCLPPLNVLSLIVLHMVKTEIGTCLASNILIQICDDLSNKTKPDTMTFNLILDGCVRFGLSLKGRELIELMARVGVVADANTLIMFSRIHEMNGQRVELTKFKDFIDRVSAPALVRHYRQFYNCLLSLHFKFNDVDSATELVQCIYRDRGIALLKEESRCHLVPIGSHNLKSGLKILVEPEMLDRDYTIVAESEEKYIVFRDGKLGISTITLAKIIHLYRRTGKVDELSRFLIGIRNSISLSDVVNACIHTGLLETAHDILDDLETGGSSLGLEAYISLLEAYNRKGLIRESKGLLKQMQKVGLISDMPDEITVSALLEREKPRRRVECSDAIRKSNLAELLVREMKKEEQVPSFVYDVNSSIYFFCKAKMMGDALRAYRRMQEMNLQPDEQTFAAMLSGYSSLEMYRDVTILWGDIKRNIVHGSLDISQDLCELLLVNFIRGGYFERVMEVITFMEERNMFADKGMCRWEYMKHHKNLYQRLKASETKSEGQMKRLECVKELRNWFFTD